MRLCNVHCKEQTHHVVNFVGTFRYFPLLPVGLVCLSAPGSLASCGRPWGGGPSPLLLLLLFSFGTTYRQKLNLHLSVRPSTLERLMVYLCPVKNKNFQKLIIVLKSILATSFLDCFVKKYPILFYAKNRTKLSLKLLISVFYFRNF